MMRLGGIAVSASLIATAWCGCARLPTQQAEGSGSETVFGRALIPGGSPAAKAVVRVRPTGYLSPLVGLPANNPTRYVDAVTDDSGRFSVSVNDTGLYCLEINNNAGLAMLFKFMANGTSDSVDIGQATLEKTATVMGMARDAAGGAAQIFGLERLASIDSATGAFSFSDLPAGTYAFRLVPEKNPGAVSTISSVKLAAGDAQNIFLMSGWTSSKRLYLNTTVTGADVAGNVSNFPVLVRLTLNNFDFTHAQAGGIDLRFTKSDNSPLFYEIERWDATNGLAEAWVRIDTVYGNDSAHFIIMYFGNSIAASGSNSAAVFDTSNGFQAVLHMIQSGNGKVMDATVNHYDGVPSSAMVNGSAVGLIGEACNFSGSSGNIQLTGTAKSKLSFPQYGTYTIAAWVNVDTLFAGDQHLVGKGGLQYSLRSKGSSSSPPAMFSFEEYVVTPLKGLDRRLSPITLSEWKNIVAVRNGTSAYLYVDGMCTDSTGIFYGDNNPSNSRDSGSDVTIGSLIDGGLHFNGSIDEVRFLSVPQTPDWIKLDYENQRSGGALIKF